MLPGELMHAGLHIVVQASLLRPVTPASTTFGERSIEYVPHHQTYQERHPADSWPRTSPGPINSKNAAVGGERQLQENVSGF